ncbi:sigma-70 family RNA polymerase sigma factor [Streptomyces sp. NPDC052015]|uniref:RNA polymerase sigma factor n=1 Tax=Streptomyces sp. NPDC052015 TaxID=3154755 RepID=UPI003437412A
MSNEAPRTEEEFNAFFKASYNPTVHRLMRLEARLAQADAQAIVARAFHETSMRWSEVRDPGGFLWDRVVKRTIDHWRKQEATPEIPCDTSERIFVRPAPMDGEPERYMDRMHVEKLIDELSPRDQRAIRLDLEGATSAQLAEALGTTENAARVCLSRAKKRFAKLVDREAEVR